MSHFRIICITQIRNEIQRGNLERFFDHVKPIVDEIVIYDDASSDGSYEYAKKNTDHVIRGFRSTFTHETVIKAKLLETAKKLNPDFILWLDADEVLSDGGRPILEKLCQECIDKDFDAASFHEINLWRSYSWMRIDNKYNDGWYVRLWRNTPKLKYFETPTGLHQVQYPQSIEKIYKTDAISVIHYGFATINNISYKYLNYRRHGQHGWKLSRFLDESILELKQVPSSIFPPDLRIVDLKPTKLTLNEWNSYIDKNRNDLLKPSISIISMIYKSTEWLKFCYEQVLRYSDLSDNEFFFIANDPNENVAKYLQDHYIPHKTFRTTSEQKKEWYINNVYRAYNYGAQIARGDYLLFINSDMAFSPNWIENMFSIINGDNCVVARLVESGKLPSGVHAISKNFGREIRNYNEKAFLKYAKSIATPEPFDGGLYMPLLVKRQHFLDINGYPEGNVTPESDPFKPIIAKQGEPVISGDTIMIKKLSAHGIRHQTSNNSIVYHFQEGEKDDQPIDKNQNSKIEVVIVNDHLSGSMGEKTMWQFLLDGLPNVAGVDLETVGKSDNFPLTTKRYIDTNYPESSVIIQNSTFIDIIDKNKFTIGILQDNLRGMNRQDEQQERNLTLSRKLVTNSFLTASAYEEFNFEVISLGVDDQLFLPMEKEAIRKELNLNYHKIGIFVGDLSPTKGWPEIEKIINDRPDIHWLVVSKYEDVYSATNVTMYNRQPQEILSKLLNAADFFILGSPVETQCLAAIEACLCNTPVIMHKTGIFMDFSEEERRAIGYFSDTLNDKIDLVYTNQSNFNPRKIIIERGLTVENMINKWHRFLLDVIPLAHKEKFLQSSISKWKTIYLRIRSLLLGIWQNFIKIIKVIIKIILPKKLADRLYTFIYRR